MGEDTNKPVTNILAGIGFLLLLAMAWYTAAVKIPEGIEKIKAKQQASVSLQLQSEDESDDSIKF